MWPLGCHIALLSPELSYSLTYVCNSKLTKFDVRKIKCRCWQMGKSQKYSICFEVDGYLCFHLLTLTWFIRAQSSFADAVYRSRISGLQCQAVTCWSHWGTIIYRNCSVQMMTCHLFGLNANITPSDPFYGTGIEVLFFQQTSSP